MFTGFTRISDGASIARVRANCNSAQCVAVTFRGLGNVAFQLVSRGSVNYRVTGQVSFGTPAGTMTRDFDQKGTFSSSQLR